MSFRNRFDHVPLLVFRKLPPQRPELAEQPSLGPHGTPAPPPRPLWPLPWADPTPTPALLPLVSWLPRLPQSVLEPSVASSVAQSLHLPHFLPSLLLSPPGTGPLHRLPPCREHSSPRGMTPLPPSSPFLRCHPWPALTTSLPHPRFLLGIYAFGLSVATHPPGR